MLTFYLFLFHFLVELLCFKVHDFNSQVLQKSDIFLFTNNDINAGLIEKPNESAHVGLIH